jgi:tetratricopeptide (TPR) repeat protein
MPRQTSQHVDSAPEVGKRLRSARRQRGLTQRDLAFPGCTAAHVSRIEAGSRVPSLQVIRALARQLDVSEAWLARGEEEHDDAHRLLRDADLALRLDDLEEAERLYHRLGTADQPPRVRAQASAGLGQLAFRRDDPRAAVASLERARELDPGFEDPAAVETLGRAYALLGQEEVAIGLFRRFLASAEEREDAVERLRFSVLLANAQIDAGHFTEAADLIGRAIATTSADDALGLARLFWTQSRFHALRSEPETAAEYARRALALLELGEHTLYQARAYQVLAHIELDSGNAAEALLLIETGRQRLGTLGTPHDEAKFAIEEARALVALGRLDEATAVARRSAAFENGHPVDRGRCYAELASAQAQQGESAQALELYELAIELLETSSSRYLVEALVQLAELHEQLGHEREALAAYKRAAGARLRLGTRA